MKSLRQIPFSYLALGDSYTIGELVNNAESWPAQLTSKLRNKDIAIQDARIIAKTGWTTEELMLALNEARVDPPYDLVSLSIGVNNQYRGYDISIYKREFQTLIDQAIDFAGGLATNVFVLSIPDYGVTPYCKEKELNVDKIALELNEYNQIAKDISASSNVQFFEITEWSKRAKHDLTLLTDDNLHPSAKMYANWVETCFHWVFENLTRH